MTGRGSQWTVRALECPWVALDKFLDWLFAQDMTTSHQHWGVLSCALFTGYRTCKISNEIEMHCPVEFQQAAVSLFVISGSQPHNHHINLVSLNCSYEAMELYTTHHIILPPPENKWTPHVFLENYLFGNPKWAAEADELLLQQSS